MEPPNNPLVSPMLWVHIGGFPFLEPLGVWVTLPKLTLFFGLRAYKGTVLGTPNRELQECNRQAIFQLYSYYILEVPCLGFPIQSP